MFHIVRICNLLNAACAIQKLQKQSNKKKNTPYSKHPERSLFSHQNTHLRVLRFANLPTLTPKHAWESENDIGSPTRAFEELMAII